MRIGIVGLGRMGANIARRLARAGFEPYGFDLATEAREALSHEGVKTVGSLEALVSALTAPRAIWIMLPAGEAVEGAIQSLSALCSADDVMIDGGNSFYQDALSRAASLSTRGQHFLDIGTSGGVAGLERGYCLMIGGAPAIVTRLSPIFDALAPGVEAATRQHEGALQPGERGWLHCGPVGAGHFVKMIHNGIEYGMMQSMAEGFDILRGAAQNSIPAARRYTLDLAAIAELWRRGSVVTSWLLDLTAEALARDPALSSFSGVVNDSGEGRWTVQAAIEEAVPAEALTAALYARFRSRQDHTFAEKVLSAMRAGFGGHQEPKKGA